MNIAELLAIPASMFPEQEVLRFEGRGFTYEALLALAGGMQSSLAERGAAAGDVVAGLDTNSPALIAALYGCAALGASFAPLNYRARADELRHMLGVIQPKLLLAGERYLDLAREVAGAVAQALPSPGPTRTASAGEGQGEGTLALAGQPTLLSVDVEDGAPAVLMFTSGTSADAKAVVLPHASLVNLVFGTTDGADGTDRGSVLLAAPLYHVAGLSALLSATFGGRRIVLMRQFDASEWLRLASTEQVTHAFVVPTMLKQVLDQPDFQQTDLSRLHVLSYGAAPMPLRLIRRAIDSFPRSVQFVNAFGQTETTSTVTTLGPDDHRLDGSPEVVEIKLRRLRSIGTPLPGVEVRILDETGNPSPAGTIGEIAIQSDRLMRGYYGDTSASASDGFLRTRDLGWIDDDGYVYLAGRKSDLIIRGGENIAPDEIEAVLESHPDVEEAAVIGLPDDEWGERVTAIVVRGSNGVSPGELADFCRQRLASFKKPETILFVDELPRNALGKVLRKDLRARYTAPLEVA
ncbi:MAG: class I adenylate-forming enzyme family protein [Chloroflexota bacterium]